MNISGFSTRIAMAALLVATSALVACGNSSDGAADGSENPQTRHAPKTKYAMANNCFALQSVASNAYAASNGSGGYAFSASSPANAEAFYMKPTALGEYLIQAKNKTLLT